MTRSTAFTRFWGTALWLTIPLEGFVSASSACELRGSCSSFFFSLSMLINIIRSYIAGTNSCSNGIVPMLWAYDVTVHYVDQGGNKRPGAFTNYIEPWHGDIFDFEFLDLRSFVSSLCLRVSRNSLLTFLIAWSVLSRMAIGPCSAQMKHQTCMKSMELNSKSCTDIVSHKLRVPSITSI
jgi:hypothetical protein